MIGARGRGQRTALEDLLVAGAHRLRAYVLVFSSRGRVCWLQGARGPGCRAGAQRAGMAIVDLEGVQVEAGEMVLAAMLTGARPSRSGRSPW